MLFRSETQAALVQALETARAQPTAASTAVPTATALPPDVVEIEKRREEKRREEKRREERSETNRKSRGIVGKEHGTDPEIVGCCDSL